MRLAGLAAAAAAALLAQPALAADTAGMMKAANGFIEATNQGQAGEQYYVASPSIVDEVAPHHWSGPNAVKSWWTAVGAWAKANGASDMVVKLGAPTRAEQTGEHGYLVAPAVFTYKLKGKAEREEAAMSFALDHSKSGWRIASWAWAGGPTKP
jgi:hypothetical protein